MEEVEAMKKLVKLPQGTFKILRYEDLSLNLEGETQKLFDFLELPFSQTIRRYLKVKKNNSGIYWRNFYELILGAQHIQNRI